MKALYGLIVIMMFASCQDRENEENHQAKQQQYESPYNNDQFPNYWDRGLAELNSYDLKQSRYGEERDGEAVLIFVTEDFSKEKQVKLDHPEQARDDRVHILKMNFTKKFITGIYPYSMMTSVFSPLDGHLNPMKITTSSQEWCGHTFTQINKRKDKYLLQLFSYFESEGDKTIELEDDIYFEDAIWNNIRTNPNSLPKGEVRIFPGNLYLRLSHSDYTPGIAMCTLTETNNDLYSFSEAKTINKYMVEYGKNHSLIIHFEKDFPYTILGWEERYPDVMQGKTRLTKATLRKQLMLDYWTKNNLADTIYRDSLMIKY